MGYDDVFQGLAHAADSAEHAIGNAADGMAHQVGSGLNAVGPHGAAHAVDSVGDKVADTLGSDVQEMQLGETDDPKELVRGDFDAINKTADHLRKFAAAFGETAQGMTRMDSSHWQGKAASAFREKFDPHPKQWSTAQEACQSAAKAWADFAQTVQWAQGQAAQAVSLYSKATQESEQAKAAYSKQTEEFDKSVAAFNSVGSAGHDPGTTPQQPGAFVDPGAADAQHARQLLDDARMQRDSVAAEAKAVIESATNLAPAEPTFVQKLGAGASDLLKGSVAATEHYVGGGIKAVGGLGKLIRSINPADPYNLGHPAEYIDGISTTAAGLVHMAANPISAVTSIAGDGWGTDPFEAVGKLEANIGIGVVTGGVGGAAEAGAGAAVRTGIEDGAAGGLRTSAESSTGTVSSEIPEQMRPAEPPSPWNQNPPGTHGDPYPGYEPGGDFGPQGSQPTNGDFGPQGSHEPPAGDQQPVHHGDDQPGEHEPHDGQPGHQQLGPEELSRNVEQILEATPEYQQLKDSVSSLDSKLEELPPYSADRKFYQDLKLSQMARMDKLRSDAVQAISRRF